MNFEEFENHARLYVVGALDEKEREAFNIARKDFGLRAEQYVQECRRLSAAFALSLRPHPPRSDAKARLMTLVQKSLREKNVSHQPNGE
ncbi:MAG: hypothetical protein V4710_01160 [Verrucomicrobiota bacterium]